MSEKGQVMKVKADYVVVKMARTEACGSCKACTKGTSAEEMFIEARNLCNAKLYDWVDVEVQDGNFIKAVLIAYGIPLICFFLGAGIGITIAPLVGLSNMRELMSFFIGLLFVGIAYWFIKKKDAQLKRGGISPVAVKVCKQP